MLGAAALVQAEAQAEALGVLLRPARCQTTGDALEAPAVAEQEAELVAEQEAALAPGALQGCGACPWACQGP